MNTIKVHFEKIPPVTQSIPSSIKTLGHEFRELKKGLKSLKEDGSGAVDLQSELAKLESKFLSGSHFSPQELIAFQIKASRFGLQVELVSKIAESALSTVRKLQNPQ